MPPWNPCGVLLQVLAGASRPAPDHVQAAMRRVNSHVDATIVLQIEYLRGKLLSTRPGAPPRPRGRVSYSRGRTWPR